MPRQRSRGRRRRPELPTHPVRTSTGFVELLPDPSRPSAVTVFINDAESSYVDLTDPRHLEFEYMQQMVAVLDVMGAPRPAPLRAVHLGGAGCALPRALDSMRPGSRQLVVEIDAELARLSRTWFDLPRSPRMRIRVGDARSELEALGDASWDVVVRDVFAGIRVPAHVRTREAAQAAAAALRPDGLYLVNLTDHPPLASSRVEVATLREVFEHVVLVADPAILRGRRYGNVVLVAGAQRPEAAGLDRALRRLPLPVRLLTGAELDDFVGDHRPALDPPEPEPAAEADAPGVATAHGTSPVA